MYPTFIGHSPVLEAQVPKFSMIEREHKQRVVKDSKLLLWSKGAGHIFDAASRFGLRFEHRFRKTLHLHFDGAGAITAQPPGIAQNRPSKPDSSFKNDVESAQFRPAREKRIADADCKAPQLLEILPNACFKLKMVDNTDTYRYFCPNWKWPTIQIHTDQIFFWASGQGLQFHAGISMATSTTLHKIPTSWSFQGFSAMPSYRSLYGAF